MAIARNPRDGWENRRRYPANNQHDKFVDIFAKLDEVLLDTTQGLDNIMEDVDNEMDRINEYVDRAFDFDTHKYLRGKAVSRRLGQKGIYGYRSLDEAYEASRAWRRKDYRKGLPRPEIMVPRQQTIESRWQSEKPYILSIHGGTDDIQLGIRGKLTGAAMTGAAGSYSGGMLSWALSAPGAVSAGIATAVGASGAGYFLYKNRKKAPEEPSDAVKADREKSRVWRLFPEQRELLTDTFSYMGIPAGYRHGYGEAELDQTLSVIDAPNPTARMRLLLEWIDKRKSDVARLSKLTANKSDAEKAWSHLDEFSHSINCTADVTDEFGLDTWPQIPLTIQALIRMHKRGSFMTEYEDEFIAIQETQDRMSEIQSEMVTVGQTAVVLGNNIKYFEMQRKALDDEFEALKKEVILFDLKMAALAYVYETDDKKALDVYSPTVSEKARGDQVELWRESIDALCEMPIGEVSPAMGTVIIGTVNKLIEIDQSNPMHGSVAKSIADYVHKIAPHIHDEGAALEAMRKIDALLSRN